MLGVLMIVALALWNRVAPTASIASSRSLDGCYEGEGLPDFMRPSHHWTFMITDGVIADRDGHNIATIRLNNSERHITPVTFTPGILIGGKPSNVLRGDTTTGTAYIKANRITIALADDWGNVMQKTSCR